MPLFTNDKGKDVWFSESKTKPGLYVGTPRSQREKLEERKNGTIIATARAIKLGLPEEEIAEVIAINAQNVEMDPDELRNLATQYIEWEESNSNGIEKE